MRTEGIQWCGGQKVARGGCDFPGVGQSEGKEDPGGSMGMGDSQHEWRKDSAGQRLGGTAVEMKDQRPRTRCFQCSPWLQSSLVVLEIGRKAHWVQWL